MIAPTAVAVLFGLARIGVLLTIGRNLSSGKPLAEVLALLGAHHLNVRRGRRFPKHDGPY